MGVAAVGEAETTGLADRWSQRVCDRRRLTTKWVTINGTAAAGNGPGAGEHGTVTDVQKPVLLGGYAARSVPCAPTTTSPLVNMPGVGNRRKRCRPPRRRPTLRGGGVRRTAAAASWLRGAGRPGAAQGRRHRATVAAMPVHLNCPGRWLPDDRRGRAHRQTRRPLVKVDGGYLPADVKHHKTVDAAKKTSMRVSRWPGLPFAGRAGADGEYASLPGRPAVGALHAHAASRRLSPGTIKPLGRSSAPASSPSPGRAGTVSSGST